MKTSERMPVWLWKMVFPLHICSICSLCWWKAQQSCAAATEEGNKYDLTAAPCF
jgi:hypothetical protein